MNVPDDELFGLDSLRARLEPEYRTWCRDYESIRTPGGYDTTPGVFLAEQLLDAVGQLLRRIDRMVEAARAAERVANPE